MTFWCSGKIRTLKEKCDLNLRILLNDKDSYEGYALATIHSQFYNSLLIEIRLYDELVNTFVGNLNIPMLSQVWHGKVIRGILGRIKYFLFLFDLLLLFIA